MSKYEPKVWVYGQWLERFLLGNHRHTDFVEMAVEAMRILGIKYEITDIDPIFHFIKKIDSKTPENQNIFDNWIELITAEPIVEAYEAQSRQFGPPFGDMEYSNLYLTPTVSIELISLSGTAESIQFLLKKLKTFEISWEKALPAIGNELIEFTEKNSFDNLLQDYEGLTLALDNSNGTIKRIQKFAPSPDDPRPMFRWSTITSKMLFDFLRYGGQSRYGYCERCGHFMLMQRSDKRFCKDLCRVYSHQQKQE